MNQKLAKAIRRANREPGRQAVAYYPRNPGTQIELHENCDRYHHQRMKRAIQRGAGRG